MSRSLPRRVVRGVFKFVPVLSLILFISVIGGWIAQIYRTDSIGWAGFDNRARKTWHTWGVTSSMGQLTAFRMTTGIARTDDPPQALNGVGAPNMQPHAFHYVSYGKPGFGPRRPIIATDRSFGPTVAGVALPMRLTFIGESNWFHALITAAGAAPLVIRRIKRIIARCRAAREGLCPQCGYDLRATPHRCPECGATASPVTAELAS